MMFNRFAITCITGSLNKPFEMKLMFYVALSVYSSTPTLYTSVSLCVFTKHWQMGDGISKNKMLASEGLWSTACHYTGRKCSLPLIKTHKHIGRYTHLTNPKVRCCKSWPKTCSQRQAEKMTRSHDTKSHPCQYAMHRGNTTCPEERTVRHKGFALHLYTTGVGYTHYCLFSMTSTFHVICSFACLSVLFPKSTQIHVMSSVLSHLLIVSCIYYLKNSFLMRG